MEKELCFTSLHLPATLAVKQPKVSQREIGEFVREQRGAFARLGKEWLNRAKGNFINEMLGDCPEALGRAPLPTLAVRRNCGQS
jgi:hypothetical protein